MSLLIMGYNRLYCILQNAKFLKFCMIEIGGGRFKEISEHYFSVKVVWWLLKRWDGEIFIIDLHLSDTSAFI